MDTAHAPIGLFTSEVALVTGTASNIGRGIAIALAREGAEIIGVDVDPQRNASTVEAIVAAGGRAGGVIADLSTKDGWKGVVTALGDRVPAMLVHSACPRRHETDTPLAIAEDTFDGMLNVNVRSGFLLAREVAQRMRSSGVRGRMLMITSLHAESPRNLPHYSASKAGLTMIMKELARDLGPSGIRVNALAPGAVPGGGAASIGPEYAARIPLRRTGTAEDMAGMAVALLSDRFSAYVTGTTVAVDGGLDLFNWIPYAS